MVIVFNKASIVFDNKCNTHTHTHTHTHIQDNFNADCCIVQCKSKTSTVLADNKFIANSFTGKR